MQSFRLHSLLPRYTAPTARSAYTATRAQSPVGRPNRLCKKCRDIFSRSKIVHGSLFRTSTKNEKYRLGTLADLLSAAGIGCHVCTILVVEFNKIIEAVEEIDRDKGGTPLAPILRCRSCVFELTIHPADDEGECDGDDIKLTIVRAHTPACDHDGTQDVLRQQILETLSRADLPPNDHMDEEAITEMVDELAEGLMVVLDCADEGDPTREREAMHDATYCSSTGSEAHMNLARFWMSECQKKHPLCIMKTLGTMPSRLIEIGRPDQSSPLRVVETLGAIHVYSCLSHCWGGITDVAQLNENTKVRLLSGFGLEDLPHSFRDAITTTRALGLQYVWIDCLCIIQGSAEDWETESAKMGAIFENAAITIAASGANNPNGGCFKTRVPLNFIPCRIARSLWIERSLGTDEQWHESSIAQRGWCHQEQILSRRMLYFGKHSMSWRCLMGIASEHNYFGTGERRILAHSTTLRGQGINNDAHFPDTANTTLRYMIHTADTRAIFGDHVSILERNLDYLALKSTNGHAEFLVLSSQPWVYLHDPHFYSLHRLWMAIVTVYSTLGLTKKADKLVAVSGLAEKVLAKSKLTYIAGLWLESLALDLLWFVKSPAWQPASRPPCPTWSWASVNDAVSSWFDGAYDRLRFEQLFAFVSFGGTTADQDINRTGQINSAILEVRGTLSQARIKCRLSQEELEAHLEYSQSVPGESGIPWDAFHLFTLHDSDRLVGGYFPDCSPFEERDVWLMPVCKAYRAEVGLGMVPYWAIWGMESVRSELTDHEMGIAGLVLIPVHDGVWKRIGLFHVEFDLPVPPQRHWMETAPQQLLTIV